MKDYDQQVRDAALKFTQAKEKVIVDCINDLIKRGILVFYDQVPTYDYNSETNIVTYKGACLLRESDRVKNAIPKEDVDKLLNALKFYADRNNWKAIDFQCDVKDVISLTDLGCKSMTEEADFAIPSGGRIARETLAEFEYKQKGK